MKILEKLSPKHLFGGSKKSRSHVSRSDPASFSSGTSSSEDASVHRRTPTSVLPGAVVSVKELEELVARIGAEPPTQAEVVEMLREIGCDDGSGGFVSVEELVSRVGSVCGPAREPDLRETFEFFDADRDGRVTAPELLGAFRSMGDERCTLEDCRRMIEAVDGNGNGFVCFEDFSRMMDQQR